MPQLLELGTKAEMLEQLSIIQQLYPDYTLEIYGDLRYTLNILMLLWKECFNVRIRYSMQKCVERTRLKGV